MVEQVLQLRRARHGYRQIAECLPVAPSTVARLLRRAGLYRLAVLEPAQPINRYECAGPSQLLHLDIEKLARFQWPGHRVTGDRQISSRGSGWEYVHLAIDDHSRVDFGSIEPDERGISGCRALLQAVRYYRSFGVYFERVLTDNGACYRLRAFRRLIRRLAMRHLRTRPYTPRTNGKAERLVQAGLRERAYARSYLSSKQRQRVTKLAASLQLAPSSRQPRLLAFRLSANSAGCAAPTRASVRVVAAPLPCMSV